MLNNKEYYSPFDCSDTHIVWKTVKDPKHRNMKTLLQFIFYCAITADKLIKVHICSSKFE